MAPTIALLSALVAALVAVAAGQGCPTTHTGCYTSSTPQVNGAEFMATAICTSRSSVLSSLGLLVILVLLALRKKGRTLHCAARAVAPPHSDTTV
jgi:hypothetical protein